MNGPSNQAIKRLISLHGWSGTVLSIFLYAVVLTGTVSVLRDEIARWSDAERHIVHPFGQPIYATVRRLSDQVPEAFRAQVRVEHARDGSLRVFFYEKRKIPGRGTQDFGRDYLLDPETHSILAARQGVAPHQRVESRAHELSHFIVDLHARLLIPGRLGLYATGVLGVFLLVAVITGILIHRHILRDLFVTERPGGRVVSLRDRHGLASVWSLPFSILLAFTGTFLSFATSLGLPIVAMSAFGGDIDRAFAAVTTPAKVENAAPADLADLDQVMADALRISGTYPRLLTIEDAGRRDARIVTLHRNGGNGAVRSHTLEFDGATGAFLRDRPLVGHEPSVGSATVALMSPLHFGDFSGLASRAVWLALGTVMTISVVSGMQLWLKRREDDPVWRSCRMMFAAVVWGLPVMLSGAAYGFFLSILGHDVHRGTLAGFLVSGFVVLVLSLRAATPVELSRVLRRMFAWSVLMLPVLRLQTGGVSWGEAILNNIWQVLLIDALCLALAVILLVQQRVQDRAAQNALNLAE
ncbi:hypothetical protein GFB49_14230 [Epibacterium sp. SM1979]|uniref:PepSY-associated TM helix n=1 Tax=Tritonibacter litoralis TaxID=2662264 RepID=A0A843YFG0_9RHOB|nr:PepSY-associated TM helix domain-containing protein [Tritonibacter litoralis]MQQ09621.1 hypothetical protein [Tritonibacter litoralis]